MNATLPIPISGQPLDHPVRLEALRETGLLDSLPEESLDRFTRLATALLNSEISLVTLVDSGRQFFKSQAGLPEPLRTKRETPLSHSFCKHVVQDGQPLVIEDARIDPRVKSNPAVAEYGVVSYLGTLLTTRDGLVLGSFCVIGKKPRKWSQEDLARLADLAGAVMNEIELRERSTTLRDALMRAECDEDRLRRQLRDFLEELHGQSAMVFSCAEQLAAESSSMKVWQADMVQRSKDSAGAILRATQKAIKSAGSGGDIDVNPLDLQVVSASLLVRRAAKILQPLADDAGVDLVLETPDDLIFLNVDRRKVERVLVILLTNAIQCSTSGSRVKVQSRVVEKFGSPMCRVTVTDDCSINSEPQSSKGIFKKFTEGQGDGERCGLLFCRKVIESHAGQMAVMNATGGGSAVHLWLPLNRVGAHDLGEG